MSVLKEKYKTQVKPALMEKFNYPNVMLVPELVKIVISMGLAEASKDKNALVDVQNELAVLTGQKPILIRSTKSIANFKLREGQAVGAKVTLRGQRMYEFLYRFIHIVCPRIRDFRGFPTKGDGMGNYSLGLDDQQIFPEIDLDKVKRTQGMNITLVTTALNEKECIELLRLLGLPFKR